MSIKLPALRDIERASQRIKGVASRTPLVESPSLSKRFGRKISLKLECFQPIRVFKIRGAFNKISQTAEKNLVAVSSGNHGIAVAYSSRLLKKQATIVLPVTAVREKVKTIEEFGAKAVPFGKYHSDREKKAQDIVKANRGAFIHPFNDPDIIAGNGTCGLEITQQLEDLDSVVVPVGGGGLVSGIAIAIKSLAPGVRIFGIEPEGAAKMQAALWTGKPVELESPASIADGLMPSTVGDLTLEACRRHLDGIFSVSDDEIVASTRLLIREAHVFPEPSGAASAAVLLQRHRREKLGKNVVLVVSGGNICREFLSRVLN